MSRVLGSEFGYRFCVAREVVEVRIYRELWVVVNVWVSCLNVCKEMDRKVRDKKFWARDEDGYLGMNLK